MKASFKHLGSPDIDFEEYLPEEEDNFGFYLEACIGPEGEASEEIFGMQVCTPKWLTSQHARNGVIFGRHLIIVFEYNIEHIKEVIREYVEKCSGDDWEVISHYLRRIGRSEFEDYVRYEDKK